MKSFLKYLWAGMALCSMFFYPLTSTLSDESYYLHWESVHGWELILAGALLSLLFAALLGFSYGRSGSRISIVVLSSAGLLPATSMAVHLSRQLNLAKPLMDAAKTPYIEVFVPALLLLAGLAVLVPRNPALRRGLMKVLFVVLLVISPMTLISLYTVAKASFITKEADAREAIAVPHGEESPLRPGGSIYLMIFDEMSYGYLYEDGEIRKAFPNFSAFSSVADNYHNAMSTGRDTMTSIPTMLNQEVDVAIRVRGNRLYVQNDGGKLREFVPSRGNIFSLARKQGYKTAAYGWYHDYCKIFKNFLDDCKSYSIYNYASSAKGFSPLNPVFTNINLWPFVYPSGYIKNLTSLPFHRNNADAALEHALKTLDMEDPYFFFIHIGLPHVPFVFDGSGYNPPADPFNPSEENYVNQLTYVDRIFGEFIAKMKERDKFDNSTIIVMSDHNFRDRTPKDEWDEIPLMVKKKGQTRRRDINVPVRSLSVIKQLFGS